jgi:hypothetical protein
VPRNAHRGGEHETLDNNNERARYQKHPARPRRPVKQNDGRTPSGQGAPQTRQAPAQAKQTSSFFDGASTTSSPLFSPQLSQPLLRLPQSSQRNQAQSSSNPSTSPFVSSTCRYNNTLFSRAASTLRVLAGTLFITGLLLFTGQSSPTPRTVQDRNRLLYLLRSRRLTTHLPQQPPRFNRRLTRRLTLPPRSHRHRHRSPTPSPLSQTYPPL